MFTGISPEICEQAWRTIIPSIRAAAEAGTTNKFAGTVVVIDPRVFAGEWTADECQQAEIFTAYLGNPGDNQRYTEIARSKALVSCRTGMPSSRIQQDFPYHYATGMTKWGGSTVDSGGLVVAFSGVQAVYDEMISEWMAAAIRAICRHEMTRPEGGVMSQDSSFIGHTDAMQLR